MGIDTRYISGYSRGIIGIINGLIVPVLIAVAFIVFLWGAYRYFIYHADNEAERAKGKTVMFYGIIGFVIIFSLWGIVNIFISTLGLGGATQPAFPTLKGSTSVQGVGGSGFGSGFSNTNTGGLGGGFGVPTGQQTYTAASLQQYNNCIANTAPGFTQNCGRFLQTNTASGGAADTALLNCINTCSGQCTGDGTCQPSSFGSSPAADCENNGGSWNGSSCIFPSQNSGTGPVDCGDGTTASSFDQCSSSSNL